MAVGTKTVAASMSEFVTTATPPAAARGRAAQALCDTIGVILAGAAEPAATIARTLVDSGASASCQILGRPERAGRGRRGARQRRRRACARLRRHVLRLAGASELRARSRRARRRRNSPAHRVAPCSTRYIVGFEIECRLGVVDEPASLSRARMALHLVHRHAWRRGRGRARSRPRSPSATAHALGIAASAACGLKENIGTMVKPLHAGMAARNGVMAARLASEGFTASEHAIDGPQGYLAAMDSERPAAALAAALADLGSRWEILDTGISVKLYPSCAATHPPLDVLLDLCAATASPPTTSTRSTSRSTR